LTLEQIEEVWNSLVLNAPMNYYFFDEQLERLYAKDRQLSESLNYFALMALFISCLGIFGIMSFSIKEKIKEIGIRKVLGAQFLNLLILLTKDIFLILSVAIIIGGALGWYLSGEWLNNFAYRFEMGFDIIIISSITTLIMTLTPISFKLVKSIKVNPAQSLRSE